MAHFSYIRFPGSWIPTSVLTAEEMAKLDADHFKSLNGDDGGTYAPAAVVTVGGAGLNVTGPFSTAAATLGTLTVSGTSLLSGTVQFSGRQRRRPRVALADVGGNQTIDTTQGDCIQLPKNPTIPRTHKLRTTTAPIPLSNERLEVIVAGGLISGQQYEFQREDGTPICRFYGTVAQDVAPFAIFEFDAGVWRLGPNSGGGATGGVEALAGA